MTDTRTLYDLKCLVTKISHRQWRNYIVRQMRQLPLGAKLHERRGLMENITELDKLDGVLSWMPPTLGAYLMWS